MDCLETTTNKLALPDDLTLTELILKIKYIWSFSHVDKLNMSILHQRKQMIKITPKGAHLLRFVRNQILSVFMW